MFYVGDILWLEGYKSDLVNFTGIIRCWGGDIHSCKEDQLQSFQDLETGVWLPAIVYYDGGTRWYDEGWLHSFQDPKTGEWMPAIIYFDGTKEWHEKGTLIEDPETYFKNRGGIKR